MLRFLAVGLMLLVALPEQQPPVPVEPVSMYAILASPLTFEGRRVQVLGVVETDARGVWLFANPWHREMYDSTNAIFVEFASEEPRAKARRLVGKGAWLTGIVSRRTTGTGTGSTRMETVLHKVETVLSAP